MAQEFHKRRVHVSYGMNIKTWSEGVMCLQVPSDHKPAAHIDRAPEQWVRQGVPVPLGEFLPMRMQNPNFTRKTRLSNLAFFDLCKKHAIDSVEKLWVKATELNDAGDRGLLAYLLDQDGEFTVRQGLARRQGERAGQESQAPSRSLVAGTLRQAPLPMRDQWPLLWLDERYPASQQSRWTAARSSPRSVACWQSQEEKRVPAGRR